MIKAIQEAALHFTIMSIMVTKKGEGSQTISEIVCSAMYLSVKLYERKTGRALMSKALF